MTASRDEDEATTGSPFRRVYRRLAGGVRWLREFNRGFAENSHFLDRKE